MDNNYNCFYSISHDENAMVTLLALTISDMLSKTRMMCVNSVEHC